MTMTYTEDDRYKHSVIDVAHILHGESKGTYGNTQDETLSELYNWLKWRVDSGWAHVQYARTNNAIQYELYDASVRQLAVAALVVVEKHYGAL